LQQCACPAAFLSRDALFTRAAFSQLLFIACTPWRPGEGTRQCNNPAVLSQLVAVADQMGCFCICLVLANTCLTLFQPALFLVETCFLVPFYIFKPVYDSY
jgi:hypothetical protein